MSSHIRAALILFTLLFAGTSSSAYAAVNFKTSLVEKQGVVVYRYYLDKFLDDERYTYLRLSFIPKKEADTEEEYGPPQPNAVRAKYGQLTNLSFVYMVVLNEGKYDVYRSVRKKIKLGEIDVKSGQATDLGAIVMHPYYSKKAKRTRTITKVTDSGKAALVRALEFRTPAIYTQVKDKPVLGWAETRDMLIQPEAIAHIKLRSQLINNLRPAFGNTMIAGGNLGQVFERTPAGSWKKHDTGRLSALISATKVAPKTYFAAGEEGALLTSVDGAKTWQPLPVPHAHALIYFVGQGPDGYLYLVSHVSERSKWGGSKAFLKIHRAKDPQKPQWEEKGQYPNWGSTSYGTSTRQYDTVNVRITKDRLVLLSKANIIVSYDFKTSAWEQNAFAYEEVDSDTGDSENIARVMIDLRSLPGKFLYGEAPGGMYLTRDYGKTFSFIKSSFIDRPVYVNENEGYAFYLKKKLSMSYQGYKLQKFTDGGKTWSKEKLDAPYIGKPRATEISPDGKALLLVSDYGAVWGSQDGGKTWQIERFEGMKKAKK